MQLKQKELLLVYAVTALLGCWFIVRVVFVPFHNKLAVLNKDVVVKEARFKKGVRLVENKAKIEKEYEKYANYFSLQNFSDEEAVAYFLKEVEKISRKSGMVILDMKSQQEPEEDKVSKQYLIRIRTEASMKELVTFLYGLHKSPLLFSVEKLTMSPEKDKTSDLSITMTIAGVSFV